MSQCFNLSSLNSPKVDQEGTQELRDQYGLISDITLYDDEINIYINAAKCGDWVLEFLKKLSSILKDGQYFLLHCEGEGEIDNHSFYVITQKEVVEFPAKLVIKRNGLSELLENHPDVQRILDEDWTELFN